MSDVKPHVAGNVDGAVSQARLPGYGALESFGIAVLLFFIPQLLAGLGLGLIKGIGGDFDSKNINHYFLLDTCIELLTLAMLTWFLSKRKVKLRALFGNVKKRFSALLSIPIFFAYLATVTLTFTIVQHIIPAINLNQEQQNSFKAAASSPEIALAFVALVVITPIIEEVIFRGFLYRGLKNRLGKWGAALLASLVFAIAHGQLNVGIDTFILSMYLIFLLETTNSLVPSIFLHAIKNSFAFFLIFSGRF